MSTKFAKIRQVTLPVLKLAKGQPRYLLILGPMHIGKKIDDQKDAATLLHAVDMETGEEGQVVVPMVMQKELAEGYPKDSYVGKGFEVTLTRVPEKRYNIVSICEVGIPDDFKRPSVAPHVVTPDGSDDGGANEDAKQQAAAQVAAATTAKAKAKA